MPLSGGPRPSLWPAVCPPNSVYGASICLRKRQRTRLFSVPIADIRPRPATTWAAFVICNAGQQEGAQHEVVMAIIKPFKLDEVRDALNAVGVHGMTRVRSRVTAARRAIPKSIRGANVVIFLPKVKVEVAVEDQVADKAISAIDAAKTGQIGDGKIFVTRLGRAHPAPARLRPTRSKKSRGGTTSKHAVARARAASRSDGAAGDRGFRAGGPANPPRSTPATPPG